MKILIKTKISQTGEKLFINWQTNPRERIMINYMKKETLIKKKSTY